MLFSLLSCRTHNWEIFAKNENVLRDEISMQREASRTMLQSV